MMAESIAGVSLSKKNPGVEDTGVSLREKISGIR
jgi:hypothetical protein